MVCSRVFSGLPLMLCEVNCGHLTLTSIGRITILHVGASIDGSSSVKRKNVSLVVPNKKASAK